MLAETGLRGKPRLDFPCGPAPRPGVTWRPWIVVMLLAACFVPRAVAAWNCDVLWADSLHYFYASLALEQGNYDEGFAELGLNIYPLLLIPLRHLGVDWQVAGKWFSVLVASGAVLPLWGWLRRMFDDRLALTACLVYALHGKLIAISPLIIRDPVFWLLLVLALYYSWRAMCDLRIRFFLAAGIALTLAVHTRTEGWLLLVPLLGWGACRWPTAKGRRIRLAVGTLLCIAMIPATVTTVNITWLRGHPRWEFLRTEHLRMAVNWWNEASGMHVPLPSIGTPPPGPYLQTLPPQLAAMSAAAQPAGGQASPSLYPATVMPVFIDAERSAPSWLLTFKLLERFVKGCTWIGGFLMLAGLVCGWRIFLRPEHLTLFCMNLLLLLISRIRYWAAGLDLRYFMPIVIIGVPWMALGVEYIIAAARWLLQGSWSLSPRTLRLATVGMIATAILCSFLDAPMAATAQNRKHAALGRWIYHRAGPQPAIVGNLDYLSLDTFYANGRVVATLLPHHCQTAPLPQALIEGKADVVVLWNEEHLGRDCLADLERQITGSCGYRRVDAKDLPAGENELMVFVKAK